MMKDFRNEQWLFDRYVNDLKNAVEIAKECNAKSRAVLYCLHKFGISIRRKPYTPLDPRVKDKQWLFNRYIADLKTSVEIAKECNTSPPTVRFWLHRFGILVRPVSACVHLDAKYKNNKYLYNEYIVECNGTQLIADELGVDKTTINNWLVKFGIPLRSNKESQLAAVKNGRFPEEHFSKARSKSNGMKGHKHSEETKRKISATKQDISLDQWNGYFWSKLYGPEFNKVLREEIRKRDVYICQECDATQEDLGRKLDVHHIDYDKTNNKPENLISLCQSCHGKTNHNRSDWRMKFEKMLKGGICADAHT